MDHVSTYLYVDDGGSPAYEKLRFAEPGGKKTFRFRRPDGAGGWAWGLGDTPRLLYRLVDLVGAAADATVFYCEGEKDTETLRGHGLVAVTAGSTSDWRPEFARWFDGRRVVILPDHDAPGRKLAANVASDLIAVAAEVRVLELPGLGPGGDITDWLEAGGTPEQLLELAAAAPVIKAQPKAVEKDDEDGEHRERKSQATELVEMVLATGIVSWRTASDEPHVTLDDGCHLALCDRRVRSRLRRLWFGDGRGALRAQSLADAIGTLEGLAYRTDATHPVHRRVAGDEHTIFLHLGHSQPVIEVDSAGWRIADHPTVRFVAPAAMQPLPLPVAGGSLDELRELHPALADDAVFALISSFMVGALRPWGSYAILALLGEQGSAKSSLARLILRCLDPGEAELRSPPRDARDLAAAVRATRIVALDNVGRIQPWLSDALCICATGGSFAARELYSDSSEHLVHAHQPVIMTAIDEVITAGDLRDRALVVRLPPMPDSVRLTDRQVAERVEAARPRILGSLLDLVARGLRRHDEVAGAHVHRLADHVAWALACEPVPPALIEAVHRAQRVEAASEQLSDGMGEALLDLARSGWAGTMAELLGALEARVSEDERGRDWPESPRGMGSALRRRAPALRRAGVDVGEGPGYGPRRDRRGVTLSPAPGATSGTSASSGGLETSHDLAPDVPDVGPNVRPTSGQRPAKNGNGFTMSDVPDVADVAPAPTTPGCPVCGATMAAPGRPGCVCPAADEAVL